MKNHKYWNMLVVGTLTLLSGWTMATSVDEKTKQLVIQSLVKRFEVAQQQITIINAESKNWPSSALGCAKKGQYYLPVMTPGYLIQAKVKSELYNVHTGGNAVIICEDKRPDIANKFSNKEPKDTSLQVTSIQLAREKFLSIHPSSSGKIRLIKVKNQSWFGVSKYCSENSVFEENISGYLIILKDENHQNQFFCDGKRAVVCDQS